MTEEFPAEALEALAGHDAFERDADGYKLSTIPFDSAVTASEAAPDWALSYALTVWVPTLQAVTVDDVGPAVRRGWYETLKRRLEDAPTATRAQVDLERFAVTADDETVAVTYEFEFGDARQAVAIAKTFGEYVEGTYVEGVIPGYEYESPVTDLIESATREGSGGTPL